MCGWPIYRKREDFCLIQYVLFCRVFNPCSVFIMPDQALITGCVSPQATRLYTPSHRQPRYQLLELRPRVAVFRTFDDAVDFSAGFQRFDQAELLLHRSRIGYSSDRFLYRCRPGGTCTLPKLQPRLLAGQGRSEVLSHG